VDKKVLVVDDNELVLYGLVRALMSERVGVETAGTGSEAVLKLSSCNYDLCLLDLHLSDFSGTLLMRIIRDICPKMKVMIMTGSFVDDRSQSEAIGEAMQAGICRFIAKPFNLLELKNVVVQALRADDDTHAGIRSGGDRCFERRLRDNERTQFSEKVQYSMNVINNGDTRRLQLLAQVTDVSRHGVGFWTEYPLRSSQVVSFEHDVLCRTGVVAWSTMLDDQSCRAGVQFS